MDGADGISLCFITVIPPCLTTDIPNAIIGSTLTPAVQAQLLALVNQAIAAAQAGDRPGTIAALNQLIQLIQQLVGMGQIPPTLGSQLIGLIQDCIAQL